jgi:heme A synthase
MLLDRADTDAQTAGDFGVTEPVKSMHEENVACSRVGAFERLPHSHQTLLSGENLIGRGLEIGQIQIFHRLALVTVATGVAVIVDCKIERGPGEKRFLVLHLSALVSICMQAQDGFLHQILGLLGRGATPSQQLLQVP